MISLQTNKEAYYVKKESFTKENAQLKSLLEMHGIEISGI